MDAGAGAAGMILDPLRVCRQTGGSDGNGFHQKLRMPARRDRRFRERDRAFRLIVTDRFGTVTVHFGDRDRGAVHPTLPAPALQKTP
jgi:hypothetical protein